MSDYPDFTVIARLKGEYGGAEKAVSVDVDGHLSSLLYGTYSGANKKILVDVDGNVRMNLYAQDLDEMVSRFKYGAPDFANYLGIPVLNTWQNLINVSGKGYIYLSCFTTAGAGVVAYYDILKAILDGAFGAEHTYANMNQWGYTDYNDHMFKLSKYDSTAFTYAASCLHGYTFESNCILAYYRVSALSGVTCQLFYALV